jgi:cytochrome P450
VYEPPRPIPLSPVIALLRTAWSGDQNLLSLLPADAYRMEVGPLGYSRRLILIVNTPSLVREIMADGGELFPKSDLMVDALEPLVGDSIFVSNGARWRQQRAMIDPAFTHIRLNLAFGSMVAAVDDYEVHLDGLAAKAEPFSLDLAMGHLTADVITRTVFSTTLASQTAQDVFVNFLKFERTVAQVELMRLIFSPAWSKVPQNPAGIEACAAIRRHLGDLVDTHLGEKGAQYNDIASTVVAARDAATGAPFTREELIDQLGVFFLAGHETTASVLTWIFFIMGSNPEVLARMRAEVDAVVGAGPVEFEHAKKLTYIRNVFRETLRLYPPITFMPRIAAQATTIGKYKVKKGALIMLSPWTMHRHEALWKNPNAFDPDRFSPEREHELTPGAYMPFGTGHRVCVGAAFAGLESALILARLARRYDFQVLEPQKVRPAARLTTRPAEQIQVKVSRRAS